MYTSLFSFIAAIYPVTPEFAAALESVLQKKALPKKTILLKEGKMCDQVHFIEKGLVRAFYANQGEEVNTGFMRENDFVISVPGWFASADCWPVLRCVRNTAQPAPGLRN